MNLSDKIILFPKYEELKEAIEKLRTELSMLVLERDELQFIECKNIEAAYLLALGSLEYKAYEIQCRVLRLKRKSELIQIKKNRQEKISISKIEDTLDLEFEEYQKNLEQQINKINDALQWKEGEFLSEEETRELKELYRKIVKKLHPDLNKDLSEGQLRLFENAVNAYKNGDLGTLQFIGEMVLEPVLPEIKEDGLGVLKKEKDRLDSIIKNLKEGIDKIKSEYPYYLKELINDKEKMAAEKVRLENMIKEYEGIIIAYDLKIKEMLG